MGWGLGPSVSEHGWGSQEGLGGRVSTLYEATPSSAAGGRGRGGRAGHLGERGGVNTREVAAYKGILSGPLAMAAGTASV